MSQHNTPVEKQLRVVAKEYGMFLRTPYWDKDLNCFTFHPGRMNDDSTWIEHNFYLAESPEDCIDRKLSAIEEERDMALGGFGDE